MGKERERRGGRALGFRFSFLHYSDAGHGRRQRLAESVAGIWDEKITLLCMPRTRRPRGSHLNL